MATGNGKPNEALEARVEESSEKVSKYMVYHSKSSIYVSPISNGQPGQSVLDIFKGVGEGESRKYKKAPFAVEDYCRISSATLNVLLAEYKDLKKSGSVSFKGLANLIKKGKARPYDGDDSRLLMITRYTGDEEEKLDEIDIAWSSVIGRIEVKEKPYSGKKASKTPQLPKAKPLEEMSVEDTDADFHLNLGSNNGVDPDAGSDELSFLADEPPVIHKKTH